MKSFYIVQSGCEKFTWGEFIMSLWEKESLGTTLVKTPALCTLTF